MGGQKERGKDTFSGGVKRDDTKVILNKLEEIGGRLSAIEGQLHSLDQESSRTVERIDNVAASTEELRQRSLTDSRSIREGQLFGLFSIYMATFAIGITIGITTAHSSWQKQLFAACAAIFVLVLLLLVVFVLVRKKWK